jgi:DedD protein
MRFPFLRSKDSLADAGSDRAGPRALADEPQADTVRTRARRRLIGAVALLLAGVVGFPLLFETQPRPISGELPMDLARRDTALASSSGAAANKANKPLPVTTVPDDAGTEMAPAAGATSASATVVATPAVAASAAAPSALPKAAAATAVIAATGAAAAVVPALVKDAKPDAKPEPKPQAKPEAATVPKFEVKPPPKPVTPTAPVLAKAPTLTPTPAATTPPKPAAQPSNKPTTTPPAATRTGTEAAGRFVVQIAAYSALAPLREARAKVTKLGLNTYTQVVETDAGPRTRLRVGPFSSRAQADAAAAKLKQAGMPANILAL